MFQIAFRSSRKHLFQTSIPSLFEQVGKYASSSLGTSNNYSSCSPVEQKLAGQVAIITGGASGIGAETARMFTKQGARVVIADIQESLAESLVKELGPQAEYVYCDVRKEEDIIKAWEKAYSLENKLDVVFNNAGILGAVCPLKELPIEEFDATLAVNLRGILLGVKHAARLMIPAKKGSIVCTAGIAGVLGGIGPVSYSASKAAVIALVKSAAMELRGFGIRVNAISPDFTATPMTVAGLAVMMEGSEEFKLPNFAFDPKSAVGDGTMEERSSVKITMEMLDELLRQQSLLKGRSSTGVDIANGALYLASDMAGYVTGHNLVVDAGTTTSKSMDMEANNWATRYRPMISENGRRGLPV